MKTKHTVLRSLILASIVLLLVFAGCQDPTDQSDLESISRSSVGKGFFKFDLGEITLGRTILPATPKESDFKVFELSFFSNSKLVETVEWTSSSTPITLDVGIYELHVTAYIDAGKPAAWGSKTGIEIKDGKTTSASVELAAITNDGQGTFKWKINYPSPTSRVISGSMKITPLTGTSGSERTETLTNGVEDSLALNSGYYRVVFTLRDTAANEGAERWEILHIYQNLESAFAYQFEDSQFHSYTGYRVTNGNDDGDGSLRQAITKVISGGTIFVDGSVKTIQVKSEIQITGTKNFILEGNGVTITAPSLSNYNYSVLCLYSGAVATIRRVHFTDIKVPAIENYSGDLINIESCIFSNTVNDYYAIIKCFSGTTNIKGSTFYKNSGDYGKVIYAKGGAVTLTGNLFYGNGNTQAASYNWPLAYAQSSGAVTSNGFNVVDVSFGIGQGLSGWAAHSTDKVINSQPIAPASFKLISVSGAKNIITSLPSGYPTVDFYGNTIPTASAAAGAVQATASGYFLEYSVNDSALGSAAIMSAPETNSDGLYSAGASVKLKATPAGSTGYGFKYWIVNNSQKHTDNPLTLTLNDHCKVIAVFDTGIDLVFLENANYKDYAIEARLDATQWSSVTSKSGYEKVLQKISNKVYEEFKDDFDFIFFVLNIPYYTPGTTSKNPDASAIVNELGFHGVNVPVSNNVKGLGKDSYDETSYYGSAGKLKSIMYFPYDRAIKNGPSLHEIAHNWAAYIFPTYYVDTTRCYYHWGVSNAGGQLGGFKHIRTVSETPGGATEYQASMYPETNTDGSFKKGGFGEFANGGNSIPYSDIELYLMGMIGAKELRDNNFRLDIYTGLSYDTNTFYGTEKNNYNDGGYFKATGKDSYTIDEIISKKGERVPDFNSSQRDFTLLTVILSKSQDTTASTRYDEIVNGVKWFGGDTAISGLYNFKQATREKGSLKVGEITKSLKPYR